ncbi:hypothetical protein HPB48_022580 [Haemaphysalis longicornis]|uniref:Uncharacterized protein n=1 Tax=Haemaphysalis longicornis TaxID=44386 RepID=A0A9J6GU31_HAELO|nr:hypothetical protein HPB48_022580 [Haemaphysalis longicornis]
MTLEDLEEYQPVVEDVYGVTLSTKERIIAPPPPSGGVLTSFVVAVMDQYREEGRLEDDHRNWHRVVEALKHAFARRPELGDPKKLTIKEVGQAVNDVCSLPRRAAYFPHLHIQRSQGASHQVLVGITLKVAANARVLRVIPVLRNAACTWKTRLVFKIGGYILVFRKSLPTYLHMLHISEDMWTMFLSWSVFGAMTKRRWLRMFSFLLSGQRVLCTHETPESGIMQFLDVRVILRDVQPCWQCAPQSQKGILPYRSAHSQAGHSE